MEFATNENVRRRKLVGVDSQNRHAWKKAAKIGDPMQTGTNTESREVKRQIENLFDSNQSASQSVNWVQFPC